MTESTPFGGRMFHTSADAISSGGWVGVQKKTFTKWCGAGNRCAAAAVCRSRCQCAALSMAVLQALSSFTCWKSSAVTSTQALAECGG